MDLLLNAELLHVSSTDKLYVNCEIKTKFFEEINLLQILTTENRTVSILESMSNEVIQKAQGLHINQTMQPIQGNHKISE